MPTLVQKVHAGKLEGATTGTRLCVSCGLTWAAWGSDVCRACRLADLRQVVTAAAEQDEFVAVAALSRTTDFD